MAAGPRLDGAGSVKMQTLHDALEIVQRLHSQVERMGVTVRAGASTLAAQQQMKRTVTPLVGLLKGQFGMIADVASAFLLAAGRSSGGDQQRLRSLREGVASLRQQLEIAQAQTVAKHEITGDKPKDRDGAGAATT